jgi:hypothetical protein
LADSLLLALAKPTGEVPNMKGIAAFPRLLAPNRRAGALANRHAPSNIST